MIAVSECIDTYEVSLIILAAIGFGLYLYGLVRLSREQKAKSKAEAESIKPVSHAARA